MAARVGAGRVHPGTASPDVRANLTDEQLFDGLAIQIDGPRGGDRRIALRCRFTDTGDEHLLTLSHGVLTHRGAPSDGRCDTVLSLHRSALIEIVAGGATIDDLVASGRLTIDGDRDELTSSSDCSIHPTPASRSSRPERSRPGTPPGDRHDLPAGVSASTGAASPGVKSRGSASNGRRWK